MRGFRSLHRRFKEKKGILSYPSLELYYKDLNKTTWCLTIYLKGDETIAYTFADYLLHKTVIQRLRMEDDKSEELKNFAACQHEWISLYRDCT